MGKRIFNFPVKTYPIWKMLLMCLWSAIKQDNKIYWFKVNLVVQNGKVIRI